MTNDTTPAPIGADALSRDTIRAIFLAHGFTVKEGQTDLKPYVYEAAEALVRAALAGAAQPALTVTARYDLSPAAIEGAIRDKLIEMGWTPPDAADPKAAPAQPGAAYAELGRSEVDSIVYACRQAGDDSTYAVVNAALRASRGQAPAPAAVAGPSDEMVLAAARVMSPRLFAHGLAPLPKDGPQTAARMRWEVEQVRLMLQAALDAAAAPQASPAAQGDALDAARWRWLSEHITVAWDDGKFTSLVRIVSERNRIELNARIDRMMAGDWSDAARAAKEGGA